jgi:hypothetical protein
MSQLDGKQLKDTSVAGSKLQSGAVTTAKINVDGDLSINSHNLTNVATPTVGTQGANKQYVDDQIATLGGLTALNKAMTASVTTSDFDEACATAIAATPSRDGYVQVYVNGLKAVVGDGVRTKDCYFSADGGATARAIAAITSGDKLYWVGSVAGHQLAGSDRLDFDFLA